MKKALMILATALVSLTALADDPARLAPLTEITLADGRDIVATQEGRTVYTFDVDEVGISKCYNGCAKAWPPVLVQSAAGIVAPMGVTTRTDGTLQLMFENKPLYLYVGDQAAGDITGDGLSGVWHIIVD